MSSYQPNILRFIFAFSINSRVKFRKFFQFLVFRLNCHHPLSCFKEFGYKLISNISRAGDSGLLTMNKFWAFENYNYLVFTNELTETTHHCERQVESFYLSDLAFAAEICLASLMTLICLVSQHSSDK